MAVRLGSKFTDMRASTGLEGVPFLCHLLSLDPVYPAGILTHSFLPMQGSVSPQNHVQYLEAYMCILFLKREPVSFIRLLEDLTSPKVLTGGQEATCLHRRLERRLLKSLCGSCSK